MPNMSYCRFENTYRDLVDCLENINEPLSKREHGYRERLVEICQGIIDDYDAELVIDEDDDEDE